MEVCDAVLLSGAVEDVGIFCRLQRGVFREFKAPLGEVKCNKVDDEDFRLLTFRLAGSRDFKLDSELLSWCRKAGRRGRCLLLIRNICLFTFVLHSTPERAFWVPSRIISEKKGNEYERR